ncbi:MAG: phosphonate ABC transporter, permease protein PhnE [Anaerolineaceae bacterium]|nr:phosphonate ABC transporter, permease protein PhnE [Anaerolineaceae bacterium]
MNVKEKNKFDSSPAKPSFVPPWLAAILSAIVPGLGQVLARQLWRGILVFVSFASIVGLMAWRFVDTAPRDTGWLNIIQKAYYLEPTLILITVFTGLLYLSNIYDGFMMAKLAGDAGRTRPMLVFIMLILVFFGIGWQIGDIDLYAMVRQAPDAAPALSRLLWPWERAITYPEVVEMGRAEILSPCTETEFIPAPPPDEGPYLLTGPVCGDTSEQDGDSGTLFHVKGYNFSNESEIEIWWKDPLRNEFRQRQGGEYISVLPDENGNFEVAITMPYRLLPPSAGEEAKVWTLQGRQVIAIQDWEFSEELELAIEKMIETIFIGMMATFFGILLALPLSFLAAKNLMSASPVTLIIYYIVRAIMNIVRSIEPLIWAIIFIIVVGLGPFAGILALTLHSAAALGKLYSESIESIDTGPIEAVQATGANWFQMVAYAVVPQIIPPFVSFTIYRWDINIRMSTIIGMVGGGGIGFLLSQWIRLLDYSAAGIAVWFIAITVAILDYVSSEIRERFV